MSLLQSFHQVVVLAAFAKMSLGADVTQQMAMDDIFDKTLYHSPDACGNMIRTHDHDVVKVCWLGIPLFFVSAILYN